MADSDSARVFTFMAKSPAQRLDAALVFAEGHLAPHYLVSPLSNAVECGRSVDRMEGDSRSGWSDWLKSSAHCCVSEVLYSWPDWQAFIILFLFFLIIILTVGQVAAGQGTIALELMAELPRQQLDAVLVPVGGGGLISGIAACLKSADPSIRVIGCQPRASNVMAQSVAAGRILDVPSEDTLSDGTAGQPIGYLYPAAVFYCMCMVGCVHAPLWLVHGMVLINQSVS